MTKVFYDMEFIDNGHAIGLISVGLVDDNGDTYYAVNYDMDVDAIKQNIWLMNNVVPSLPTSGKLTSDYFTLDSRCSDVKPKWVIRNEIREWLAGRDEEPELWAWFGAYDHVALAQLFGRMSDLPAGVPMWTNDIRQLQLMVERATRTKLTMPEQKDGLHNALADAMFNHTRYGWLREQLAKYRQTLAVDML